MMISLDPVAAADYYQQAIALQGATGDPRLDARLHYRLSLAYAFQGRGDESALHFRESMVLARSLMIEDSSRTLEEAAVGECFLGRFAEALKQGQDSLALYRELNDRYPLHNTHLIVANILLHLGDWEGCRAHAEEAVAFVSWEREQGFTLWAHANSTARAVLANGGYGGASSTGWRPSASPARPKSVTRTAPPTVRWALLRS